MCDPFFRNIKSYGIVLSTVIICYGRIAITTKHMDNDVLVNMMNSRVWGNIIAGPIYHM